MLERGFTESVYVRPHMGNRSLKMFIAYILSDVSVQMAGWWDNIYRRGTEERKREDTETCFEGASPAETSKGTSLACINRIR